MQSVGLAGRGEVATAVQVCLDGLAVTGLGPTSTLVLASFDQDYKLFVLF